MLPVYQGKPDGQVRLTLVPDPTCGLLRCRIYHRAEYVVCIDASEPKSFAYLHERSCFDLPDPLTGTSKQFCYFLKCHTCMP